MAAPSLVDHGSVSLGKTVGPLEGVPGIQPLTLHVYAEFPLPAGQPRAEPGGSLVSCILGSGALISCASLWTLCT